MTKRKRCDTLTSFLGNTEGKKRKIIDNCVFVKNMKVKYKYLYLHYCFSAYKTNLYLDKKKNIDRQ